MLNKPTLRELMQNVDSKYTLVLIASKRARSLVDKNPELLVMSTVNPVSVALDEIATGKLAWTVDGRTSKNTPEDAEDLS